MTDQTSHSPTIVIATQLDAAITGDVDIAQCLTNGVHQRCPGAEVIVVPVGDGGPGTAACFAGEPITLPTTGPHGRLTDATYIFDDGQTSGTPQAFIDLTAAGVAGPSSPRLTGDTYGVGVLVADALARGARRIALATGSCDTIDGGTGILTALGCPPVDAHDAPLSPDPAALTTFSHFDLSRLNTTAAACEFLVLTAPQATPLFGESGAAATAAARRGVTDPDVIAQADAGLRHLATALELGSLREDGAIGAGGAVALSLIYLSQLIHGPSNARVAVVPAAATIAAATGLSDHIRGADVVVTGTPTITIDSLTTGGVGLVCAAARQHHTPLVVMGTRFDLELPDSYHPVMLDAGGDIAGQMSAMGATLAEDYLATRTDQG